MTEEIKDSLESVVSDEVTSEQTDSGVNESSSNEESQAPSGDGELNYDLTPSAEADSSDDLPEGIKARIGRANKKISALEHELQQRDAMLKSYGQGGTQEQYQQNDFSQQQYQSQPDQNGLVFDPLSGQHVDPNSTAGQFAIYMNQVNQNSQRMQQHQQQQEENARKASEIEALNSSFSDSVESAKSKFSDYKDVVLGANYSDAIVDAARLAHNSGELLYFLGKNPKEVARISNLTPLQQAREVMRHSAELQSRKKVSSAPSPSKPLGETAGSSGDVSASNYEQWQSYIRGK